MTDAERLALALQNRSLPMASPSGQFIPTPPLEMQPQASPYNPIGIGELALSMGTGALAQPIASIYGAGNPLVGGDGKKAANRLAEALTYQPTTEYGQATSQAFGEFADKSGLSSLPPYIGLPTPKVGAGAAKFAAQEYGAPIAEKGLSMYEQGKLTPGIKPTAEMEAWHGTPHEIVGNFDLAKVGTGEGAQAYGFGMYYGGARATGEKYRKDVSRSQLMKGGDPTQLDQTIKGQPISQLYESMSTKADRMPYEKAAIEYEKMSFLEDLMQGNQFADALKRVDDPAVAQWAKTFEQDYKPAGNLYKVDIPDEQIPLMLNWDEPLNRQPKNVKDAFSKLGITVDEKANRAFLDDLAATLTGGESKGLKNVPNPTGESLYNKLVSKFGSPEAASKELSKLGVTGIRYLDEGSRGWRMLTPDESTSKKYVVGKWPGGGAEQKYFDNLVDAQEYLNKNQTSNYVVLKPETVKILEKNDVPVTRKELLQQEFDKLDK
jgi:hypothetical protein